MEQLDLISVAEAARRLNRSTEQVRRYLREQRLRGHRIGGQWFIETKAVDAFVTRQSASDGFLARLRDVANDDPLAATIGLTEGIGTNLAAGKLAYRLSYLRRH